MGERKFNKGIAKEKNPWRSFNGKQNLKRRWWWVCGDLCQLPSVEGDLRYCLYKRVSILELQRGFKTEELTEVTMKWGE